jgi:hypothetical protein
VKALNAKAETVFNKLIEGLTQAGDHKKIDNANGTFMALNIDVLEVIPEMMRVSLAHNYVQQGDVMADPDVELAVMPTGVFPLTFQQDNLGIYRRWAWQEDGQWQFHPRGQADLAAFCNQWMLNIAEQQNLGNETVEALDQRIETAFNAADAAHAQTQETLRKLEASLKPKTDNPSESRTWECPECGHVEEIDQEWLADHGEPVCGQCDVDMTIQPNSTGI